MSRGFLMFAHNNAQIDYGLIALCNALMIKATLRDNAVALVTDAGTYAWLEQAHGAELLARAFDHVYAVAEDCPPSLRRFHDTQSTAHDLPWRNHGRRDAYALTPFDETVLIDCDYLVCDRSLDAVWGGQEDIAVNRRAVTLDHGELALRDRYLNAFTIPMYWATCVYFRKGEEAARLFDLVSHVSDNYAYYQFVYGFPGAMYRNDYAFSIALHMLNGFSTQLSGFATLPNPTLLSSFDCDELIDAPARGELTFLVQDAADAWRFQVGRTKGVNVHVMNKFSIIRQAAKIIALYGAAG